jgi:hypothetical protein
VCQFRSILRRSPKKISSIGSCSYAAESQGACCFFRVLKTRLPLEWEKIFTLVAMLCPPYGRFSLSTNQRGSPPCGEGGSETAAPNQRQSPTPFGAHWSRKAERRMSLSARSSGEHLTPHDMARRSGGVRGIPFRGTFESEWEGRRPAAVIRRLLTAKALCPGTGLLGSIYRNSAPRKRSVVIRIPVMTHKGVHDLKKAIGSGPSGQVASSHLLPGGESLKARPKTRPTVLVPRGNPTRDSREEQCVDRSMGILECSVPHRIHGGTRFVLVCGEIGGVHREPLSVERSRMDRDLQFSRKSSPARAAQGPRSGPNRPNAQEWKLQENRLGAISENR